MCVLRAGKQDGVGGEKRGSEFSDRSPRLCSPSFRFFISIRCRDALRVCRHGNDLFPTRLLRHSSRNETAGTRYQRIDDPESMCPLARKPAIFLLVKADLRRPQMYALIVASLLAFRRTPDDRQIGACCAIAVKTCEPRAPPARRWWNWLVDGWACRCQLAGAAWTAAAPKPSGGTRSRRDGRSGHSTSLPSRPPASIRRCASATSSKEIRSATRGRMA